MTIKFTTYQSEQLIDCGCLPQAAILCVSPEIVAQQDVCQEFATASSPFEYHHIEGTIVERQTFYNSCGQPVSYKYIVSYDDSQLIDGKEVCCSTLLGLICNGCEATYVRDTFGNEPYLRYNDDATLTLVTNHGCEYTFSSSGGTTLVTDTDSVDLTITAPSPNQTLSADVNISEDEGNTLEIREDGLYTAGSTLPTREPECPSSYFGGAE